MTSTNEPATNEQLAVWRKTFPSIFSAWDIYAVIIGGLVARIEQDTTTIERLEARIEREQKRGDVWRTGYETVCELADKRHTGQQATIEREQTAKKAWRDAAMRTEKARKEEYKEQQATIERLERELRAATNQHRTESANRTRPRPTNQEGAVNG
jgi:hypothetical protein